MVDIGRIQNGIARYIDSELVPKMNGLNKWVFSAVAAAYIADAPKLVERIKDNTMLAPLNLIDAAGNVDVDKVYTHLKPAAAKCPAPIAIPGIGTITLTETDVDALYNYIIGG